MSRLLFGWFLLLGLSACTLGVPMGQQLPDTTRLPSLEKSKYGNPSSYVVMGQRYYVMDSATGFSQRGVASWYGPDFHGKRTSSGETYDMHAMTAAHKTLPIPVYVRVKNLSNGKSVVVKVNDRGPFAHKRIIDLSYAAAKKLDMVGPGTSEVEIEVLSSSRSAPRATVRAIPLQANTRPGGDIFLQLGSFGSQLNAQSLHNELTANKESAVVIRQAKTDKGDFYRVWIGPLLDVSEAELVQKRLSEKGYPGARIVIED